MKNKIFIKNWFGMDHHPTDEYIHWKEKNPEKMAKKLRDAYENIVCAGFEDDLKILLDISYELGKTDEFETHLGAEL